MEKGRKVKIISLCALLVAVLGLTVAFAALSQTLTINGSATVDTASWDIHFEASEKKVYNSGDGHLIGTPTINGTTISNFNVSVSKPNDEVDYYFKTVNNGTINAKIESFEVSTLCTLQSPVESCDWDNDGTVTKTDVDKVNNNFTFVIGEIVPVDGEYGNSQDNDTEFNLKGRSLLAKKQKTYAIYFGFEGYNPEKDEIIESTELPKRDLTFNNLSVTINYVQTD